MLNPDDLHERLCKGPIYLRDIKRPGYLLNSREAMAVMREIMDYIEKFYAGLAPRLEKLEDASTGCLRGHCYLKR